MTNTLNSMVILRIDIQEFKSGSIVEWVDKVLSNLVTNINNGNTLDIKYNKVLSYFIDCIKSLKQKIGNL
jgi:hypothetical protein